MREGWISTTLGNVAKRQVGRTPPRRDTRYWTTDLERPFCTIADMRGRFVSGGSEGVTSVAESHGVAKRVPAGALLLSFKLSLGRVGITDRDVFPNEAIAWLQPREGVLRDYLALALQTVDWESLGGRAVKGKTLNSASLDAVPLLIAPLCEQRRIVDLIGALDDTIAAADAGIAAGVALPGPLIDRMLASDESWPQKALGEVGRFVRGKRFTKSEYVESGLGCIHYGQLHTHFGATATETITFLPQEAKQRLRLAEPGDVVIAATSENVEDLGRATAWLGSEPVAVHDDCYIWKHDLNPVFASYVFASPAFQDQKVRFAAGMKVTRISGASLAKIEVAIPPLDVQQTISAALSAAEAHTQALRAERSRLSTLRTNLLTALLSGEHEIPESYDELLEAV